MSKQLPSENKVPLDFAAFFETAFEVLKPPFMKLLSVFVIAILLALLLVKGSISPNLGLVLVVVVVLIFAFLAATLQYAEMRFLYSKRTEEQLKNALRDTVMELQEKSRQVELPGIQITYIEFDPPGDDIQGEFVTIRNLGKTATDMTDWTLRDEAGHQFTFPPFTLRPGAYMRVWTKVGTNTATDLYWGREQAIWSNTKDCAYLQDNRGVLVDTYRYRRPSLN